MATEVASLFATISLKDNLTSGLKNSQSGLDNFATALGNIGTKMTALGQAGQQAMMPIMNAMQDSVFAAMSFDEAMTNANSILQLSEKDINAVSDQILAMGRNAIAGPQEVALAYYDIVGGVADVTTHMDILNTAIAVSEAGSAELAGTTKALVSVMNSYKFSADKAAYAGDVLNRITATGIGTLDEFGAALPAVTGLAASLGIEFDEVGSMMAFFTTKGFTASTAATMLQASMTALIKPNELLKDAYAELGVSSGEALINMYGLDGAIAAVASTSVAADEGLPALLGTVDALNAATALAGAGWREFDSAFHGATVNLDLPIFGNLAIDLGAVDAGITGSTEAAREFQRASPAAQFALLKSEVAGLAIEIGTALLPPVIELMNYIKPLVQDLVAWVQENPKLVAGIGIAAVALLGLFTIMVPLGIAISALGAIVTGFGLIVAIAFSPVTLVIVALIALGALLYLGWVSNFGGIRDFIVNDVAPELIRRFDVLTTNLNIIKTLLITLWAAVSPGLNAFKDGAIAIFGVVGGAALGLVSQIAKLIGSMSQVLGLQQQIDAGREGVVSETREGRLVPVSERAGGGQVSGNTPYLVGEQGPELFMPSSSGSIVPNGKTRGLMSGGGGSGGMVVQNINVYGVQNAQELYDELVEIEKGRWGGLARI